MSIFLVLASLQTRRLGICRGLLFLQLRPWWCFSRSLSDCRIFTSSTFSRTLPLNPYISRRVTWKSFSSSEKDTDLSSLEVDFSEFAEMVRSQQSGEDGRKKRLVVDVREPEELVESGEISGTINIPLGNVEEAFSEDLDIFEDKYGQPKPSLNTDIVFLCRSGVRSLVAIEIVHRLGYSKLRHYKGGYIDWEEHVESDQ